MNRILLFLALIVIVPGSALGQKSCRDVLAPARGNLAACHAYLCGNYPVDACWALRSAAHAVVYGPAGTGHCEAARDALIAESQYPSCVCEERVQQDLTDLDSCYETRCPQLLDLYQTEFFPVERVMRPECREILDDAMQNTGRRFCPQYREQLDDLFQQRAQGYLDQCIASELQDKCANTAGLPDVETEIYGFVPPGSPQLPGGNPASDGRGGAAVSNPNALGKAATNFVRSLNSASTRGLLHFEMRENIQEAKCRLHYFRKPDCLYPGVLIETAYELGGASGSERALRYSNVVSTSCDRAMAMETAASQPKLGVGADGRQLSYEYVWVVPR